MEVLKNTDLNLDLRSISFPSLTSIESIHNAIHSWPQYSLGWFQPNSSIEIDGLSVTFSTLTNPT